MILLIPLQKIGELLPFLTLYLPYFLGCQKANNLALSSESMLFMQSISSYKLMTYIVIFLCQAKWQALGIKLGIYQHWLNGCLVVWLVGCLIGWLVGCLSW